MARQTREHRQKKRIVRTLIFPTVLYGCEMWTMTKKMEKRSTRVRCGYGGRCKEYHGRRRRLIAKTNSDKKKARILWTCYAIRWTRKRMMLAHGDGRRRRERPRRKWMDEIHEVTGMKLAELRDVTAERKHWRRMVKTVARTRRVDCTR